MPTSEKNRIAGSTPRPERAGRILTHLCGGALAANLLLVLSVLGLLVWEGSRAFWPRAIERIELRDGTVHLAEVTERAPTGNDGSGSGGTHELKLRVGNRELTGVDFQWVKEDAIVARSAPPEAVLLER